MTAPVAVDLTARPGEFDTGDAGLDDLLATFHFRLVVDRPPAEAMVGLTHLLAAVPGWLDDVVADDPAQVDGRMLAGGQWRVAVGALGSAGARLLEQLEVFG